MDNTPARRIDPEKACEVTMQALQTCTGDPADTLQHIIRSIVNWNEYHANRCCMLEQRIHKLEQQIARMKKRGFVYVFQGDGYCKIGYSNNPPRRRTHISPKLPFDLHLICSIESMNARALETELHVRFEDKHVRGEWFRLDDDDLEYIKSLGAKDEQSIGL